MDQVNFEFRLWSLPKITHAYANITKKSDSENCFVPHILLKDIQAIYIVEFGLVLNNFTIVAIK
jgi:hypothetical protein